jgi:hypothetical protein
MSTFRAQQIVEVRDSDTDPWLKAVFLTYGTMSNKFPFQVRMLETGKYTRELINGNPTIYTAFIGTELLWAQCRVPKTILEQFKEMEL